jgi:hypothetical protein
MSFTKTSDNNKVTGEVWAIVLVTEMTQLELRQLKMKRNPCTLSFIVVVPESAVCFISRKGKN